MGAVLAGGAARRMGTPKADLEVDGVPMLERAASALVGGGAQVVAVVGGAARSPGRPTLADDLPGEGPLAALATALGWARAAGAEVLVLAACDQPDLDVSLIRDLLAALEAAPSTAVGAVGATPDGRRHPFPSAWRVAAAEPVERLVASGERAMRAALDLGVASVAASAGVVADLDTPEQLAARRRRGPGADVDRRSAP